MASVLKSLTSVGANAVRDAAINQIPKMIEDNEPAIEKSLSTNLTTLKSQHPDHASLFLTNWRKINVVVEKTLGSEGGRRKRTRKVKGKARKY